MFIVFPVSSTFKRKDAKNLRPFLCDVWDALEASNKNEQRTPSKKSPGKRGRQKGPLSEGMKKTASRSTKTNPFWLNNIQEFSFEIKSCVYTMFIPCL